MQINTEHIKGLISDFISENIRNQDPAGLCFPTSLLLQVYLAIKGKRSSLIKGKAPELGCEEHYWLQIDLTDIIVDATIKQFKNPDPIYVGKLQKNEITRKYISSELEFNSWFINDSIIGNLLISEPQILYQITANLTEQKALSTQ